MNKEKFINSIAFKNNIILYDGKGLKKEYDEKFTEPFKELLKRYNDTKELDEGFFYLSDVMNNRIIDALNLYRFDGNRTDEELNTINNIIIEFNTIKSIPQEIREKIIELYKKLEEKKRKYFYGKNINLLADVLNMIENDFKLFDTIEKDSTLEELSKKENNEELNTPMFLIQGLNNFLDQCPELFEEESFKNKSQELLDSVSSNRKEKKHIKMIKKQIKKY